MLIPGRVFSFLSLLVLAGVIFGEMWRAKAGFRHEIRKIPALEGLEEGIGRATEMGRPIHFSAGVTALTTARAPDILASLEYLSYVASRCASMGTKLIATVAQGDTYAATEEVVRSAYLRQGAADKLPADAVRFLGSEQYVYASGITGILTKEKVATNIMIGRWADETLFVSEAGHMAGCFQIGGTNNPYQIPFFVVICNYVLLGDELFAGSAYLSQDPIELGAVAGQDFGKAAAAVLIIIGSVLAALNIPFLANLLKG